MTLTGEIVMTPFSFEWQWNADYIIFMGLLYIALAIIGCGLVYCFLKTWMNLEENQQEVPPGIPSREKYSEY
jgi:hypothetical protein